MAEQLSFDLPVKTALGRDDFFISAANALAVQRLDATEDWTLSKLILVGPKGAGKTHLAHIWADANAACFLTPDDLAGLDPASLHTPVVLEDADRLAPSDQEALFHLHNHLGANGLAFLMTAQSPPVRWPLTLPDLKSRMQGTDIVLIDAPDDALLAAMFVKLFTDRQLAIAPDLIPWLVTHADRSFDAAQSLVAALDRAALSSKRAITTRFARAVLDKQAPDAP